MKILFFDGYCNLCNRAVDWLIRRDAKNKIQFASLQGETAQKYLPERYQNIKSFDTVVYFRSGQIYERSSALLMVLQDIGGIWALTGLFFVVPPFLRNVVYRFVARTRYSFFGKRQTCRIPTPQEKEKLLP